MIKILQVLASTDRGGTESLLVSHLRYLDQGFHFDFINHMEKKCDYDDEIRSYGCSIYHFPKFRILRIFSYIKAWNDFFILHSDYDVVHVHYFTLAGIILPIARKHGVKVRITHAHSTKKANVLKRFLFNLSRARMIKNSTLLMACSQEAGQNLFQTNNFKLFYNAIESGKFVYNEKDRSIIRKELGIKKDDILIGNIGSFRTTQKNHYRIIRIFTRLCEKYENYKLVLVGDGLLRSKIEEGAKELGISNKVIFTGVRNDVSSLMSAMDVFFLPSLYEGLPVVAIEAQASGLPVVMSTAVSEESSLTDIVTRIDLNEKDDSWTSALHQAAGLDYDRTQYQKVIVDSGYDVKNNVKILQEIYRSEVLEYESCNSKR